MSSAVVEVTYHAVEQFKKRFPSESGAQGYLRLLIAAEVEDALNHNRYSTKQPIWSRSDGYRSRGRRNRTELDRTLRYVWTENRRRIYLIDRRGIAIRVVTSINPEGIEDQE